jgi:ribosomal protein S18 acetylase RimI-like enzyme
MYVSPAARRRTRGREILRSLEREAALRHSDTERLEIGDRQPEAEALYESAGYRAIERFGDYATDPRARCYERDITPAPAD